MLEELVGLDAECFNRLENPRTIENIKDLYENNPEGCYVAFWDHKIAGYIFTHRFAEVGYLGPLGIKPEYRKLGIGKDVVAKGIEVLLDAGCKTIGLEVLPEIGNNVGLYLKSNFIATYPTIMFTKKATSINISQNDAMIISGADISVSKIEEFDMGFRKKFVGYSFLDDILWVLKRTGQNTYFYLEYDRIVGFLCYSPVLYPFVWGTVNSCGFEKEIFLKLFSRIENQNPGKELKIRANSRYLKINSIFNEAFLVERCYMRMMLKGYEGQFLSPDPDSLVVRAWMG